MKVIQAQQIDLTDDRGRVRIRLTASSNMPHIELMDENGKPGLTLMLDEAALPSVTLGNPTAALVPASQSMRKARM